MCYTALLSYLHVLATWNIANTYQIDNQGANIGIYVAVLILGITVNACGLKFNAWLNRVMSKSW